VASTAPRAVSTTLPPRHGHRPARRSDGRRKGLDVPARPQYVLGDDQEVPMSVSRSTRGALAALAATAVVTSLVLAVPAQATSGPARTAVRHVTRADLARLRQVDAHPAAVPTSVAAARERTRGLPTFTGSYDVAGVTYPYTMLGTPPASGRTARLKTVLVPLRMAFTGFAKDVTFDPAFAVRNMMRSPLYQDASYPNGRGQFADQMQRATFWGQMDSRKRWHTLLAEPDVSRTFTITVTPATGTVEDLNGAPLGNMSIDAFDAQLHAILPALHLDADETPLFVTQSVTADALGYHDAFAVPDGEGGQRTQTLIWSSWLDAAQVGPLLGDVSTLNHEVAEWVNDPFVDNAAPLWAFPPFNISCGDNPYVEVGDPQGNGPDYASFPTIPVRLGGYTYHLQDLALLQWFTRQSPSSAYHGWYAFPDASQLTTPAVDCPA
jgi:hypothetical protein